MDLNHAAPWCWSHWLAAIAHITRWIQSLAEGPGYVWDSASITIYMVIKTYWYPWAWLWNQTFLPRIKTMETLIHEIQTKFYIWVIDKNIMGLRVGFPQMLKNDHCEPSLQLLILYFRDQTVSFLWGGVTGISNKIDRMPSQIQMSGRQQTIF